MHPEGIWLNMNINSGNIISLKDAHDIISMLLSNPGYHITQSEIQVGSGSMAGIEAPHEFNRLRLDIVFVSPGNNEMQPCSR